MKRLSTLSRREREILDIVYRSSAATASEVRALMADPPGYSAVRATLRILEQKGVLKHEHDGKRYVYRPRLARDKAREGALEHLLTTFFEGSVSGAVLTLLDRPDLQLSETDVERISNLIERARKEGR
ncbi:MAG TPA: BlaI/MecI/CopY family transcriptional regulator [Candidatus Sulfotelmatobacter sp.]|nr:BlaI/MecI/CopY family transcriptional regulator [Candidatus Sulfotelmatobacter sp.]